MNPEEFNPKIFTKEQIDQLNEMINIEYAKIDKECDAGNTLNDYIQKISSLTMDYMNKFSLEQKKAMKKNEEMIEYFKNFSFGSSNGVLNKPVSSRFSFGSTTNDIPNNPVSFGSPNEVPNKPISSEFSFGSCSPNEVPNKPVSSRFTFGSLNEVPNKPEFSFGSPNDVPRFLFSSSEEMIKSFENFKNFSFGSPNEVPNKPVSSRFTFGSLNEVPNKPEFSFGSSNETTKQLSSNNITISKEQEVKFFHLYGKILNTNDSEITLNDEELIIYYDVLYSWEKLNSEKLNPEQQKERFCDFALKLLVVGEAVDKYNKKKYGTKSNYDIDADYMKTLTGDDTITIKQTSYNGVILSKKQEKMLTKNGFNWDLMDQSQKKFFLGYFMESGHEIKKKICGTKTSNNNIQFKESIENDEMLVDDFGNEFTNNNIFNKATKILSPILNVNSNGKMQSLSKHYFIDFSKEKFCLLYVDASATPLDAYVKIGNIKNQPIKCKLLGKFIIRVPSAIINPIQKNNNFKKARIGSIDPIFMTQYFRSDDQIVVQFSETSYYKSGPECLFIITHIPKCTIKQDNFIHVEKTFGLLEKYLLPEDILVSADIDY